MTERYGEGPIQVRRYDSRWPAMFETERGRLAAVLGSVATTIEHVGSTAVPGMAAKPIIDILVTVDSLAGSRAACITALDAIGYTHLAAYESWLPEEMLFRQIQGGRWTHHVHVTEMGSARWQEFVLVRDYLRRDMGARRAYARLKRRLAEQFGDDIEGYRAAKRPFLRDLLERARHGDGW
jgi:GrpB-like predicted nucleotidyltransferase (UPF0157 family)